MLPSAYRTAASADGAAFVRSSEFGELSASVPVPTSSGRPVTPARALPWSTHALTGLLSAQLQQLPTAVPHWPVPASWIAPEPLL